MELATVNDLRMILADEIKKIRAGETTAANVNAVVNASGKIFTSIKMELEYAKLIGHTPNIPFIAQVEKAQKKIK
jgi:hypothetical protein